MNIITRSEARAKLLKIYYTAQPCKNGHITYRYVQSGSCAGCIRANNMSPETPEQTERKEALKQLVVLRVRAHDKDYEAIKTSAWALAVMRFPILTVADIEPRLIPTFRTAGTAMYPFYCHHQDVETLTEIAIDMVKAFGCDLSRIEVERAKLIEDANANFHDTTPP